MRWFKVKNNMILSNHKGALTVVPILLGAVGLFMVSIFTLMVVGDKDLNGYRKILAQREKVSKPVRVEYVKKHFELDKKTKKSIINGNVSLGFTEEQVRIARNSWGTPQVNERADLPLRADKELMFFEAPEIKSEGEKAYFYFKNDKLIGFYFLPVHVEFTDEDKKSIEKYYNYQGN